MLKKVNKQELFFETHDSYVPKIDETTDLVDTLLDSEDRTTKENESLNIANHLNQGFLKVFDGQYTEAINHFRQI